jgi:hypothetical protein
MSDNGGCFRIPNTAVLVPVDPYLILNNRIHAVNNGAKSK